MKLISQIRPAAQHRPTQRTRPPLRWLKPPNTQMLSLVVKTLFMLAVLAIAVHAVNLMAHTMQALTRSVGQ